MLALVPNPPPLQAQQPTPRKMDFPASEYSVLVHLGHGLGVPAATHRSPPGEKEQPKEPLQQETCRGAALSIFPPREGTEAAGNRDGAREQGWSQTIRTTGREGTGDAPRKLPPCKQAVRPGTGHRKRELFLF